MDIQPSARFFIFFPFGETLFLFSFSVSLRDLMASQAHQWCRSPAPSLLSPLYFGHAATSPTSSPPFLFTAFVRLNPSLICLISPLLFQLNHRLLLPVVLLTYSLWELEVRPWGLNLLQRHLLLIILL